MTFTNGWEGPKVYAAQLWPEPVRDDWTPPTPEVGIVPLRPLQTGDILGGAFRAVRYAPLVMFGLTLLVLLVAQLLGTLAGYVLERQVGSLIPFDDADPASAAVLSGSTLIGMLATGLTSIVVNMGLMYAVSEAVVARRVTPVDALRHMGRRLWPALGLSALYGLAVAALAMLFVAVVTLAMTAGPDGGLTVFAVLGLAAAAAVLGTWVGTRLLLAPCAIAVENLGPIRAIKRSWTLTRGLFWRILGIYLLANLIVSMAAGTVAQVFSFAGMLLAMQDAGIGMLVMMTTATLSSTVLTLPLTSAVTTLLYVDARIRREGYDIRLSEAMYG